MNVKVYTTGGTIDKVYFDAKDTYAVGEPQIAAILHEANVTADFEVETLFRKDSLDMTDADRAVLVEHVRQDASTRVLITHGTDTMVLSARALAEVTGKTIVLVGSLSPARFKSSDAEFNIGFAFAAVQILPPGVYIAMNGRVFDPEHVRKNRDLNRFEAV
ncbi:MAG TPA: asparaginase domain-containing protein [Rhodothermales bacterium]|nr:asparaginase domain-containing protein [Rhodothermales bacterium]